MKKFSIIFCGPPINSKTAGTISGGIRRYKELYRGLKQRGYSPISCSSAHEMIITILKKRKTETTAKRKFCIVFDERYLLSSALAKFFGYKIVFCPRGNKLEHYKYSYSYLRLAFYRVFFPYFI
jgi:hypothetical protein